MDYMTKPLSRIAIRHLSKYVRKIFELNESELFPVLEILKSQGVNAKKCKKIYFDVL